MHFRIETSVLDCPGCGSCADFCPANPKTGKALTMTTFNPDAADMKLEAAN
jgi:pyruvate-ferredoxin/flavodoxin oxidoreductase